MSGALRDWIDARADGVPPSLLQRMRRAADEVDARAAAPRAATTAPDTRQDSEAPTADGGLHMALAAAALSCLREAAAGGDDRAAAPHLLAADALITHACEVAAADDALDELARACAAERLAALVDADGHAHHGGGGAP